MRWAARWSSTCPGRVRGPDRAGRCRPCPARRPFPAAGGRPRGSSWRTRRPGGRRPGARCSRSVGGGLTRSELADFVGRPILAELPYDRSAVTPGRAGVSRRRSPPGPRWAVWPGRSWPPCHPRRRRRDDPRAAGPGAGPAGAGPVAPSRVRHRRPRPGGDRGLLGDDDVLVAVTNAVDELAEADRSSRYPRTRGDRRAGPAARSRSGSTAAPGWNARRCGSTTTTRCSRLAVRLAAQAGRRLDDAAPWVDAGLPDGTRLHAVLAPVSGSGTCLSLRVLRRCSLTLDQLAELGTLPGESALIRAVVVRRLAFLVTGGTGSGKTTLLSALLGSRRPRGPPGALRGRRRARTTRTWCGCSRDRRTSRASVGVTLQDLVQQALRMRPDRLVVGGARRGGGRDARRPQHRPRRGLRRTLHANR